MATTERREGMLEMKTDIALIKQRTEFIERDIAEIVRGMDEVRKKLETTELLKKKDLDAHAVQDRWLFGFMLTILIAILGVILSGHNA